MAEDQGAVRLRFTTRHEPSNHFELIRLVGEMQLSQVDRFELDLASEDVQVDLEAVLYSPASVEIERPNGDVTTLHGILADIQQLDRDAHYAYYRATLVPPLWHLGESLANQIYQDSSIPEIVAAELREGGLSKDDFRMHLTREYAKREYVVQYAETDLAFVSRWLEHEGLFYYHDYTAEGVQLVISDESAVVPALRDEAYPFRPLTGLTAFAEDSVHSLQCRMRRLPERLALRDYNYRLPKVDLEVSQVVKRGGSGLVSTFGEHFKTGDEGRLVASLRAEELRCRELELVGSSDAVDFRPGAKFSLTDHFRPDLDQSYVITSVRHEATHAVPGIPAERLGESGYHNTFTCIPASIPYRPPRRTPKPRVRGIMSARVEAATASHYAEIDDEGRYRLRMPFDRGDSREGMATRYVRKAQPHAGSDQGMHFPLHPGTEVLWACIDGDPDRPVILGAVPNHDMRSVVTAANRTKNVIRTASGATITFNDA